MKYIIDVILEHMVMQKTLATFSRNFHWTGAYRIVSNYMHICEDCLIFGHNYSNLIPELKPITAYYVLEIIIIDCVGPMVKSTHSSLYILTL